ncbi:hypothetical protein CDD80_487 [Ophiocordyceps camponoti-rufipedis]|uniref:Amino acid permease/ SLC12A domain-containing protein n=1 Tax=Ophiocordyceps camponoti-rufipedis TaxID=2004952 RepID=A0A2C5Z6T1_9HYPO|nr:hypothetical protein CDD80_487 [Ophiocordyceps camponoti-rufipedis]
MGALDPERTPASSKLGHVDSKQQFEGPPPRPSTTGDVDADQLLQNLGYKSELVRSRSTLHVAFMSFVLAAIPYGLATTFSFPLVAGGPVDIFWGWLLVSAIALCTAASLAEITSIYPTAGGVYYQAFMLAPPEYRRIASWICGWLFVVGNVTITLSVNFGTSLFLVSCINVFEKEPGVGVLEGSSYQVFLIFIALTVVSNVVSALGNRWLPVLDTAAVYWTFAGTIAIMVTVLAVARNGRRSASFALTHFEANSGWPSGWSFFVGLLHAGYATSSTGMVISMCEEVQQPSIQVPKALVYTIFLNTAAGCIFLLPLVFVLPDIKNLISISAGQPVPFIVKDAVGSSAGAFCLLIPILVLGVICGIGCTTASSRCTWAFARDGAIPGSKLWTKVNRQLDVPLNAMMLSAAVQIILGLIYFGSTAAFNAFTGVGVICLTASYAVPIAISLLSGRKQIRTGSFYLGPLGTVCNVIAILWSLLALPLFCMPLNVPVTATTANYAAAVFVVATTVSTVWYWVWGHKNYAGPPVQGE